MIKRVTAIENGRVRFIASGSILHEKWISWDSTAVSRQSLLANTLTFIEGFNIVTYLAPSSKPVGIEKYEIESVDGDILVLTIEVYEEVVSDGSNNTVS